MNKGLNRPFAKRGKWKSGVSEAVGTVLMLGISISLAGVVALWVSNIDEGEEGIYTDIWATVQGTELELVHRGGDILDGFNTYVILRDETNGEFLRDTYHTLSGNDDRWSSGETLSIDLTGIDDNFEVIVTSNLNSGNQIVILSSSLSKTSSASGLPDLAITKITFLNSVDETVTKLNDDGTYRIHVEVTNFGSDMTEVYFQDEGGARVSNLRLFDEMETLNFSSVSILHYDDDTTYGGGDNYVPDGHSNYGIMANSDIMEFNYTWMTSSVSPRTLGLHRLNVKVVPHISGEVDYRNNYVERTFTVDKLVTPMPIFGPDPGIYDISFSNDAPNSGDEVTVTVIIQNSGDQPILPEHGVHLVVSTWQPMVNTAVSTVSYDWRVDSEANYGKWKSEVNEEIYHDTEFPTCVIPDISLLPGAYFFYYFTLEARVDVPGGEQWVYAAIDVYENAGHLEGIAIENGDDNGDNFALGNIQVLPRIMIVDGDGAPTGSENDMTSSVMEALIGSGVNIDRVYIPQVVEDNGIERDAPAFEYIQEEIPAPAMVDYDIVVWVTGYRDDPLTNDPVDALGYGGNIQEIMKYLDSRNYFMLVGASPFKGLSVNFNGGDPLDNSGVGSMPEYSDASDFIYRYMGISRINVDQDIPETDPTLYGIDHEEGGLTPLEPDSSMSEFRMLEQSAGNELSELYTARDVQVTEGVGFEPAQGVLTYHNELPVDGTERVNTIRTASTPYGEFDIQFRSAVLGFDITQIKYLNEKIDLISSFLIWFDWQINVGRDLAITSMELSIMTEVEVEGEMEWVPTPISNENLPKYLDTILIEATVRNNGRTPESTSVMFYVTGPDGIELPVATGIPDPTNEGNTEPYSNPKDISGLGGNGGEEYVYKYWLAVGVGTYTFRVVVDPYHLVSEISEDNNDITYSTSTVTSFVTQNNILVVDDDHSDDNFVAGEPTDSEKEEREITYDNSEPSSIVEDVLTDLEYDYETFTVKNSFDGTDWNYNSGLTILDLKRYNSVIWVTGASGGVDPSRPETLTSSDILALTRYLDGDYDEAQYLDNDHHENVMLIGQGIIDEMIHFRDRIYDVETSSVIGDMISNYLGLDPDGSTSSGIGQNLYGQREGDMVYELFSAIDYDPTHFTGPFDYTGLPLPDPLEGDDRELIPSLYNVISPSEYYPVSTQFHMKDEDHVNYFHTIVHSFDITTMNRDSVETSLYEMVYLSMHWFGTPEDQPELLSRNSRITFDNDNPVLGNSYLIELKIANLGGVAGGGTVRFTDGNTLVKSESIYLDPDTTTTVEAIWTPLYAGNREIVAWIDRYDDYDEVFDQINNVPFQRRQIYFFWDDMENGSGNFRHSSTDLLINGEGKLDYMEEPTDVNIENEWAMMDGFFVNQNVENPFIKREYKSSPVSYFMHEPSGSVKKAVDVSLAIDSSGSMGEGHDDNDPDNVRKTGARDFIDNMYDEDRVAVFDFDNSVRMLHGLSSDKNALKSVIGEIDSYGGTALYDAGVDSLRYMATDARGENEVVRAVVLLTDGYDTSSSNRLSDYLAVRDQYDDNPSTEEKIYVFTIRLVDGDENILKQMCTQPWDEGPYYFYASDASDLNQIYSTIRTIIQGLSQSTTRSSETRGATLFQDDFDSYADDSQLAAGGWTYTLDAQSYITSVVSNSTPNSLEIEGTDQVTSPPVDLSAYRDSYLEFYWRSAIGDWKGAPGIPEAGDRFWMDIYTSSGGGTWVTDYYLINNNCFSTPWTRERIQLPPEAVWSDFRVRFRADTSTGNPYYDAYYLDDVKIVEGIFGPGSLGLQDYNLWDDGVGEVRDKFMETRPVNLRNADDAMLSFNHKYNMKIGSNGGVLMVGTSDFLGGPYTYKYVNPDQPYTGNTLISAWETTLDDYGTPMKWCFNGRSDSGTMNWDKITVGLEEFTGNFVKIRFQYLYNQGGTGYGWIIDDVKMTVTSDREDSTKYNTNDPWKLIKADTPGKESHSGEHAWFAGDPVYSDGDLPDGIDASLYTRNIDLTNARNATLSAYFRFNLDRAPGRPPDGFRVEVSSDGGDSWVAINLGVRSAWSVSGTLDDESDGLTDGNSFSGLDTGNNWVEAGSLTRLITSLDGFTGNVIIIRFRVVTDTDQDHFDSTVPADFKGFYVDDVIVYGESLETSRSQGNEIPGTPEDRGDIYRSEISAVSGGQMTFFTLSGLFIFGIMIARRRSV